MAIYTIGQLAAANEILVTDIAQNGMGLSRGISMDDVRKCIGIFRDIPFASSRPVRSWVVANGNWGGPQRCHLDGMMYSQSLDTLKPGTKWPDPVGRMLAQCFDDRDGRNHVQASFQEFE